MSETQISLQTGSYYLMKTAIITGGGRGIGRETAMLLAVKGVNVVVCSRTQKDIDETVSHIRQTAEGHAGVAGTKCDVSISSDIGSLVSKTVMEFGAVDILVNNAGVAIVKRLVDTSEKEWNETINSNLKGAFLCSQAVVPGMVRRGSGTIINVSSVAGKEGSENLSAYCASKFGMIGLAESLAWEVAGSNIRVMSICPGEVATKMQEDADPAYYRTHKDRMLRTRQVAEKIVEMIFDGKKYRNGQSVDMPNE